MRAQLRDVLTAEDSAPMPEESNDSRLVCPKRTQAYEVGVDIR